MDDEGKTVKPMFFKMITQENGYKLMPNTKYRYFKTSMDYLQRIVASVNYRQSREAKSTTIPFMEVVREPQGDSKSGYYGVLKGKIIDEIKRYKALINKCYIGYEEMTKEQRDDAREEAAEHKAECINFIDEMSSHEYLMYIVLKELEKKENACIKTLMFDTLFGKPNETFMCMIEESKESIEVLKECDDGDEVYYDFKFRRTHPREK